MTNPRPFYFAYVASDQVAFNPTTMNREDEKIVSLDITHAEGQVPTLDIVVKNPRIGLLSPGRSVWAYLSRKTALGVVKPLFFGVLVGIPTDLFAEQVTLKFISRASDYIFRKQAHAETMKVRPYYDPVFLDVAHRDDPDAILEGWSALYHIDRVNLNVTHSDVLEGEDGTVTFLENQAIYKSVKMKLGKAPLSIIEVNATVNWTQTAIGYVDIKPPSIRTYTGASLISDWPKPGANLGGGWSVISSKIVDVYKTEHPVTQNYEASWTNPMTPEDGKADCTFQTWKYTTTATGSQKEMISEMIPQPPNSIREDICIFGPGVIDPPVINISGHTQWAGIGVPVWAINSQLVLRYDANRKRSENLVFSVTANTQAILTSPTVEQHTELITISGSNVGEPLFELDAWSDFIGQHVDLGQIIFPNNPTRPGGRSYQICVQAGTAGTTEPTFSDTVGQTTNDNTVIWSSLGLTPVMTQPQWPSDSFVPVGEIICPTAYVPITWQSLVNPNADPYQTKGVSVNLSQIILDRNGNFQICTLSGTTGLTEPVWATGYGQTTIDDRNIAGQVFGTEDAPIWTNIGKGSSGSAYYICTRAGRTNLIAPPNYNTVAGSVITDGAVQWTSLGIAPALLGIPIGGTPGNVISSSYFPSDRGRWSIEYLICKARAHLRMRARAVTIDWECPWDAAEDLSCRKNATIFDPRIPGGAATGKIISYSLRADGKGNCRGYVSIGCSVGFGGSVPAVTGTPVYTASSGYMQPGYQQYVGATYSIAEEDIGYTPPVYAPSDDGLVFPLNKALAVYHEQVHGSLAEQKIGIAKGLANQVRLLVSQQSPVPTQGAGINVQVTQSTQGTLIQSQLGGDLGLAEAMAENSIWYELDLNPVTNGPFTNEYTITITQLELPEGINLMAPSSP